MEATRPGRAGRAFLGMAPSYLLGLVFILLVTVIWAGASVLIQYIYSGLNFDSPFGLTYICTSLLAIYLPWVSFCHRVGINRSPPFRDTGESWKTLCQRHRRRQHQHGHKQDQPTRGDFQPLTSAVEATNGSHQNMNEDELEHKVVVEEQKPWSHVRTMRASLIIAPLWFVSNFCYNQSLDSTSVTSNTIISTTSSLWTFLFSTMCKLEGFSLLKVLGLALSMAGTLMVGLSDDQGGGGRGGGGHTVGGDVLCLLAAIMYGMYTTLMRVLVPDDHLVSFQILFGYLGLINAIAFFPVLLLLIWFHPASISGFSWKAFGLILANGFADNVLSDYFWARAIVLTSPTVATVGLSLTIPLAFVSDSLMGKRHGLWQITGALAVLGGFVLVSYETREGSKGRSDLDPMGPLDDDEEEDEVIGGAPGAGGGFGEEEEEEIPLSPKL